MAERGGLGEALPLAKGRKTRGSPAWPHQHQRTATQFLIQPRWHPAQRSFQQLPRASRNPPHPPGKNRRGATQPLCREQS